MSNNAQLWPEGELFTCEVMIPTGAGQPEDGVEPVGYEDFPVMVTFIVPPFDIVVETWMNKDPSKSYDLFRQFIADWDQEEMLTDKMLMGYLYAYPGTDVALFKCWMGHIKCRLAGNEQRLARSSMALN